MIFQKRKNTSDDIYNIGISSQGWNTMYRVKNDTDELWSE